MKKLIAFDLDGTLAESKQPLKDDMANTLADLMDVAKVAVISGGDWPQFETQIVARLPARAKVENFYIMPTTGTKLYTAPDGKTWAPVYADLFTPEQRDKIVAALEKGASEFHEDKIWGEKIEDRGSQITFSGLGQQAPLDAKTAWDPDFTKRKHIQKIMQAALPELSINVGGSTSIDITQKGVDKAYAMRRLADHSGVPVEEMLFLGDAIYPGGNDYSVKSAGMDTLKVRDPEETMTAIGAVVACLK